VCFQSPPCIARKRLGLAGAICAALGFALNFDHEGWAAAACLLVMRPHAEMARLRAAGRAVAVTLGALAATLVADLGPPAAVMAALVLVDLVLLAGTRTSRWYVTGGFTTFIVISLILSTSDTVSSQPLSDRVIETVIGVGAALVFTSFHVLRPVRQREL